MAPLQNRELVEDHLIIFILSGLIANFFAGILTSYPDELFQLVEGLLYLCLESSIIIEVYSLGAIWYFSHNDADLNVFDQEVAIPLFVITLAIILIASMGSILTGLNPKL